MGRAPCCDKTGLKKGPWTAEEDEKLVAYIKKHGQGNWRTMPKNAGLARCGKSCRLRWTNYLRPDIKRGRFSFEEEEAIVQLHCILGNKWSAIAARLPGRTDNEIKNHWNTHIRKRLLRMGIDPVTHLPRLDLSSLLEPAYYPTQPDLDPLAGYPDLLRLASTIPMMSGTEQQQMAQPPPPQLMPGVVPAQQQQDNMYVQPPCYDGQLDYAPALMQMASDLQWSSPASTSNQAVVSTPSSGQVNSASTTTTATFGTANGSSDVIATPDDAGLFDFDMQLCDLLDVTDYM